MARKLPLPLQVTIESLDFDGDGRAKYENKILKVPFTVPGDVIQVNRIFRKKKKYVCLDFDLLTPSSKRVDTFCDHFGRSGGCGWQQIDYKYQIEYKELKLKNLLNIPVKVVQSPIVERYRNRMDVAISPSGIGFKQKGQWWNVIDTKDCILANDKFTEVIESLRKYIKAKELSIYSQKEQVGFLRYIVIRTGINSGKSMVELITTDSGEIHDDIKDYFNVDSIYWSINNGLSDTSTGEIKRFWGDECLREVINGISFDIHPHAFFQANSSVTELLMNKVLQFSKGSNKVLDMYSGLGTFGIFLAKNNINAEGADSNTDSISLAKRNCRLNQVEVNYHLIDDSKIDTLFDADTVLVDPPRAGLHKNMKYLLLQNLPSKIIYISCNPKTLAIDLVELQTKYNITYIQGYDMFPNTPHVEVLAMLDLV